MKLAKKITTISTIVATCIMSLLLILLIFDVKVFGEANGNMIISFATLAIGGFFAINSLNMLSKNKVIAWISLGLILASVVLIIFSAWLSLGDGVLLNVTLALGLLSVLFNIIVSSGLDLGRSKMIWQVIVYIVVAITDLISTLAIFGVIKLGDILPWFLTLIVLSVVGVIILKVLAKKVVSDLIDSNKDMVKISKEEYEMLLSKASKYDELMKNENK